MKWPIIYNDILELGNIESNIAICSLWTHRKVLLRKLHQESYAIIGNLYRPTGISPIIRNICANPRIRYLVLWGNDLSDSGDALLEFMTKGVDESRKTPSGNVQIETEIDLNSVELMRKNVRLIDFRGKTADNLNSFITGLEKLPPFSEPIYFPASEKSSIVSLKSFPSEVSGFKFEGRLISEVWLEIIHTVMRFGILKKSSTESWREILNVVAVIKDEDPDNENLPEYMQVTKEQLSQYYPKVLTPQKSEGTTYTYGERLRSHEGIDQIQIIIEKLKSNPSNRRMIATTWNVVTDAQGHSPPCMLHINGIIYNERFLLTAYFRAQDMFGAWPINTFAIRKLQSEIAKAANIPLGPLTMISHSAHIYEWHWEDAVNLDGEYKKRKQPAIELDPRGYIIISIRNKNIEAMLHGYDNKVIDVVSGSNARKIGIEITRRKWFSDASHAFYLGSELMKAEVALNTGLAYVQDKPLDLRDVLVSSSAHFQ